MRLTFAAASTDPLAATATHAALPLSLTILLVDDDPILLRSLRETLELDGHSTLTANGGQQGIDLFRSSLQQEGPSTISAVITDLGMPYVDGRSVARAVKQLSPSTPVILLTGWGGRLLAEGEKIANIDGVLSKPPRLRELRKALAQLTLSTSRP